MRKDALKGSIDTVAEIPTVCVDDLPMKNGDVLLQTVEVPEGLC